jgi:hypothetical protein
LNPNPEFKGAEVSAKLSNFFQGKKVAIKTMKDVQTRRMHQFLAEATVMT